MDDSLTIRRLVVGSLSANCYIVGSVTTGDGLLIDPGGDAGDILQGIAAAGCNIKIIVLTHGHSDHVAALHDIQVRTGAEVAIHIADAQMLRGRGGYNSMFGISYKTPEPPGRLLKHGDTVDVGDIQFSVIHTPGHTPGSMCLYGHERLFTGDTLFYHSIGTTYTYGSSRPQLIESIHTRLMVLPDTTRVLPGHGRETSIGAERQGNRLLNGRRL